VADVTADVYVIPTETPEAEGTLARDLGGGYPRGRCIPRDLERVALAREVWARYRAPNLHARVGVAVPICGTSSTSTTTSGSSGCCSTAPWTPTAEC
jgi:hypothetical protein